MLIFKIEMTRNYEIPLRAMLEFARRRQLSRQFCEKNFSRFDAHSFPLIFFFLHTNADRQKIFDEKNNKKERIKDTRVKIN